MSESKTNPVPRDNTVIFEPPSDGPVEEPRTIDCPHCGTPLDYQTGEVARPATDRPSWDTEV